MSPDSRHFTPVAPTQFARAVCPKDDGSEHLCVDVRLPVSMARLLDLFKALPNCWCGEALIVGQGAPARPSGPVCRGKESGGEGTPRMYPPRGVPGTPNDPTPRGGFGDR